MPADAVIYSRVSTVEQEREGYSIPAQLKMLREYARSNGLNVLIEYTDSETARSTGRTGFNRMLAFISENTHCKIILVEKTDRLTRNMTDFIRLDIEKTGLEVHFVRENKILNRDSSPAEFFIQDIQIAQAAFVSRNISAEAKKGMQAKAEQGIYPSYAPLGYLNIVDHVGRKVIAPDPVRAPLIARIFEEYAKNACSLNDLVCLSKGIALNNRNGKTPSKSAIHKILRNPVYKGVVRWRNRLYQGIHEPLVTPVIWQKVQWALTGGNNVKTHRERHSFAYSGLIKCAVCGCSLSADRKKGKYVYYHCTGYKGKHVEPYTREEVLDKRFAEVLQELSLDDVTIAWLLDTITVETMKNMEKHKEIIQALEYSVGKEARKLDILYDDRLDGRIDINTYDRKSNEIQESVDLHRAKIEALRSQNVSELPQTCEEALELSKNAHILFLDAPDTVKRQLLQTVLSNCTWSQDILKTKFIQPFAVIADTNMIWKKKKAENPQFSDFRSVWYPQRDSNSLDD